MIAEQHDSHIRCSHNGAELFRYVFRPDVVIGESPKPYFHPLRTLSGRTVTVFRPTDHRWHTGLAMTCADISGGNFWGGHTYVHPDGYRWIENFGVQRHVSWDLVEPTEESPASKGIRLVENLHWISHTAETWLHERREIEVDQVVTAHSAWTLSFATSLTNVSQRTLEFGSPTTRGREAAGYGGLFWRGKREFADGGIVTSEGVTDAETAMGLPARWLAFHCPFDEVDETATMVFVDDPDNPRYPNKWFVRKMPGYPAVSFSFMFDELLELAPGGILRLRYRVIIADGVLEPSQIEELAT